MYDEGMVYNQQPSPHHIFTSIFNRYLLLHILFFVVLSLSLFFMSNIAYANFISQSYNYSTKTSEISRKKYKHTILAGYYFHRFVIPHEVYLLRLTPKSHLHQPLPYRYHVYSLFSTLLIVSNQQALPILVRLGILHQ